MKAIAVAPGFSPSAVANADYIITPPPPAPEKFILLHRSLIKEKQFDPAAYTRMVAEIRDGTKEHICDCSDPAKCPIEELAAVPQSTREIPVRINPFL